MTNEQIEDLQEQLLFLREQLAYALQQKEEMGPNTPFLIRQVIHDNRAEIRKIKTALSAEGIEVEDDPADEVPVASQALPIGKFLLRRIGKLLSFGLGLLLVVLLGYVFVSLLKPQPFTYMFRIQAKHTHQNVVNAQVSIELQGILPAILYSDGEGLCSFRFDRSYLGKWAQIRVEAVGYQSLVHEIEQSEHQIPEGWEID